MQAATAAGLRPSADARTIAWGILAVLLAAALLALGFIQLLDAGSNIPDADVESGRVLQFDAATATDAPADAGPVEMAPRRECLMRGMRCERDFVIRFEAPPATGDTLALFIPLYTGNLVASINGKPVADSTKLQSHLHIGQGAPLLVPVHEAFLEPGGNELRLHVTRNGYGGFVGPVYIGPDDHLRKAYDLARTLVVILPRLVDGMLLALGLVMLLVWCVRRHETLYLLCAVMSLCLGVTSLSSVAADSLDGHTLLVINLLRFVAAALTLPFAWLYVGRRPPVHAAWFLLLPIGVYLSITLLPGTWGSWLAWRVFVPVVLLLALSAMVVFARAAFVGRDLGALLMFSAMALLFVMIGRDTLVNAGALDDGHLVLARFNGPILAVMMGTIVLSRLATGLALLEQFNKRLRHDVDAAAKRLQQAFDRERAHERQATLQGERMRLMGDLHDGIAGQLVSIIALCEQRDAGAREEIAAASNRALTDLRLVVDSMEDVGDDLGMTLVAFRERVEPQMRRSGVSLEWNVRALPDLPGLYPAATLAIFRILQEAVNNAVRHSGSRTVEVSSADSPLPGHGARLVVRDRGHGGASGGRTGHGLDNMRRRAKFLGASLDVGSDDTGTQVTLDLPLRLEQPTS